MLALKGFFRHVGAVMSLADLQNQLRKNRDLQIVGLDGSAPAALLARVAAENTGKSLFIVAPDHLAAEELSADFEFYSQSLDLTAVPLIFPTTEEPYHGIPVPPDVQTARLAVLRQLQSIGGRAPIIIAPITACAQTLPPKEILAGSVRTISLSQLFDRDEFTSWLVDAGYSNMSLVEDVGSFALRGAIIDVWPPGEAQPVRIELDADTVNELRSFDPSTQRGAQQRDQVTIGPADTFLLTAESKRTLLQKIKQRADDADLPVPQRAPAFDALNHDFRPPQLRTCLPLLYDSTTTLIDHVAKDAIIVLLDSHLYPAALREQWDQWDEGREHAELVWKLIQTNELLCDGDDLMGKLQSRHCCKIGGLPSDTLSSDNVVNANTEACNALRERLRAINPNEDPLTPMAEYLRKLTSSRHKVTIVCHTSLAAERTLDLFRWHGLDVRSSGFASGAEEVSTAELAATIQVVIGELKHGFVSESDALAFITETEIFGSKIRKRATKRNASAGNFLSFQDMSEGDCVVHEQHGIGRYLGLVNMELPGQTPGDFVHLEYMGGDKLYLPVYRLNQLQRYIGPSDSPPMLDKLGGVRWSKARKKALQSIRTMAHELLKIYAARKVRKGHSFSGRDHVMEEFEATFPYDETPDQWQAIEDCLNDMQDEKPMDRLVCGDVGYGKTEVAMRAAFRAAMDGKQVCILCPTTILAFQHSQNFAERFAKWPLRIELLSRFRSADEQKTVIADLANGKVDIVIGTHRLFQKDIKIPRMGLLIIDEEQRFGVAHKESMRKLRETVDTLALTATPIPRTLHMALSGMRDISVIQTPPVDRHAVRTFIVPFEDRIIREAIMRELKRGGQIFFVHNRVQTIGSMADHIRRIAPEASIVIAHGQMAEGELEKAMGKFVHKEADLLLCTSIVESGLDIPAANTLIVNRADTFGLAQLYQIRGRVGRSSVQARAHLLIPSHADLKAGQGLTDKAARRLATLARYTELGSGFSIAMHDLEMRGSGNLLGAQQHGNIAEIGYELFSRLLERAIRKMKGEAVTETIDPEISLPVAATLPAEYIPEESIRVVWYKRLASCEDELELEHAESELKDRFGPIPSQTHNLLRIIAMRVECVKLGIDLMQYFNGTLRLRFHESTPVDAGLLMQKVVSDQRRYQIKPDGILLVKVGEADPEELLRKVSQTLREFTHLLIQ